MERTMGFEPTTSSLGEKLAKNGQNEPVRPDNENRRQCETDGG